MKDKRENHPNIITDVVEMPEANSTVEIYRGKYFIKNEKYNIRVKGRITYDWFPSIGVRFYGNINNDENEIRFLKSNNTYYCNVFIDGLKLGKGIIRRLKIETTPKGVYFTPKVYQYFNPKVYHFNLISKSVFLPVAVPPPEGKQAFLF